MADYIYNRARLVPVDLSANFAEKIPIPSTRPAEIIDIDESTPVNIKKCYRVPDPDHKRATKPSLACGPDTISLRHITDLMPSIEPILQMAFNKPFDKFHNISSNFNRLISKENPPPTTMNEKSLRPIAELNILPKYGPIQVYMNQLRDKLIPHLNDNQYSFPGKGGPLAIVVTLDDLNLQVSTGRPTLLILWDFSNAFCTFHHEVAIKIAKHYNLSDRFIDLLIQFLKQDTFRIKMEDKTGLYLSKEVTTGVGGQQGQIGVDFIFSLVNDSIQPKSFNGEYNKRKKYVDDFSDILNHLSASVVFTSVKKNTELIYEQATSLGLKLNESKLKILPFNIPDEDIDPDFIKVPDSDLIVPINADMSDEKIGKLPPLLGVGFGKNKRKSKTLFVSTEKAANNLLARLRADMGIVIASRKTERNLTNRLKTATSLVWKSCYDIGTIYPYMTAAKFDEIVITIRKVIKLAGLDQLTPREVVYTLSTTISPLRMAHKQIIALGIKQISPQVLNENRNLVPSSPDDKVRPFHNTFKTVFNLLPSKTRKFIQKRMDPRNEGMKTAVKEHLKALFQLEISGFTDDIDKKRKLAQRHRYSKQKVDKRIEISLKIAHKRKFTTPTGQRTKVRSKINYNKFFKPCDLKALRLLQCSFPPSDKKIITHAYTPRVPDAHTSTPRRRTRMTSEDLDARAHINAHPNPPSDIRPNSQNLTKRKKRRKK